MNNESQVISGNSTYNINADLQATSAVAVTPSDATVFPLPCTLYVGVTGNINVVTAQGETCLFSNVPVGFFPVLVTKVMSTSTTASSIIRLS